MPADRISELLWNYLRMPIRHEADHLSVPLDFVRPDGLEPEVVQFGPDPVFAARIEELDAAAAKAMSPAVEPAFLGGLHLQAGTVDLPRSVLDVHGGSRHLAGEPPSSYLDAVEGGSGVGGTGKAAGSGSLAPSHQHKSATAAAQGAGTLPDEATLASEPDEAAKPDHRPALVDAAAEQVVLSGENTQVNTVVIDTPGSSANGASGNSTGHSIDHAAVGQTFGSHAGSQAPTGFTIDAYLGNASFQTALLQINSLMDADENQQAGRLMMATASDESFGAVSQSTASGGNSLVNQATLVSGSDGYDLIVVTGNYYEYNIILQFNLIIDRDFNRAFVHGDIGDTSASQQTLTSGGNMQVNEAAIVDVNSGGGLQLIGGLYSEHFVAFQSSILFDGDVNVLLAAFGAKGMAGAISGQFAASGGNVQINAATFGFEEGNGASADVAAWLGFLANPFGGGAYAIRLVDADGRPINVLYVEGDYHDINLIVQINVIDDSDCNTQVATGTGGHNLSGDGFGTFNFDQFTGSGGNSTVNQALIIDDNGGFGAQVVAGNYTEFNIIVQENVLFDGDVNAVTQVAGAAQQLAHDDLVDSLAQAATTSGDALQTMTG